MRTPTRARRDSMTPARRTLVCVSFAVSLTASACGQDQERPLRPAPGEPVFDAEVHVPARLRGLETRTLDARGALATIRCETCHDLLDAPLVSTAAELGSVHAGLTFAHGSLACGSCHAPEDRASLRLADETRLDMTDAMTLCAQCHGPRYEAYRQGAHGGMAGHWDLSAGPQLRNNCVDCHDPHAPAYPQFDPMPGPRDRFFGGDHHD